MIDIKLKKPPTMEILKARAEVLSVEKEGGKTHRVRRRICITCNKVLSQFHEGCCGYLASGFSSTRPHRCGKEVKE